jgi:3-isopropylmalate dehydrogenase
VLDQSAAGRAGPGPPGRRRPDARFRRRRSKRPCRRGLDALERQRRDHDGDRFDVVVTENLLGDIVSELAAGLIGGVGLSPSAEVGVDHALFQPCHGSAPDLTGRGVANPLATVLSAAMLLDWVGQRRADDRATAAATAINAAVSAVIRQGPHTPDLGGTDSTEDVTQAVISQLSPELVRV